ncbi:hemerythrin domain-containing protein [Kribbella pittospori]|uniref:hemerythrin domain-containing protein n=1 Tax=Kribbella pittospori TaxID=722689 RepID=UPI001EDEC075|nr:hemerythrin domain-containing protein [Kribbella pittospori]
MELERQPGEHVSDRRILASASTLIGLTIDHVVLHRHRALDALHAPHHAPQPGAEIWKRFAKWNLCPGSTGTAVAQRCRHAQADQLDRTGRCTRCVQRGSAVPEKLKDSPEKRPNLLPVLTTLLTAHSRAEEAEVYPVAAAEAGEKDEVSHSQQEHIEADELLAKLAETDPESAEFETVLQNLIDAVSHHVEEEETEVLPGMRSSLSDERRTELGEAFVASRKQHLGETTRRHDPRTVRTASHQRRHLRHLGPDKLQQIVQSEAES